MSTTDVQKFRAEGHELAYQKLGRGPAVLLAFHGFGQSSQAFTSLENSIGNQFTIFAIDLFFHGDSTYGRQQLLSKLDWHRLLEAFLESHQVERFSLLGFSLGGRFALTTIEAFHDRVDQLFLIAPDGITRNIWNKLATGSRAGRVLFRYALNHLPLLIYLGHALVRLGLLNRSLMRFAEVSLASPRQRGQAYQSWTQLRQLQPDLNKIAALLNEGSIRVRFFTGALDRIVPGHYILPLTKRLTHYTVTVLPARHNHLIEQTGAILATAE